MKLSLVCAVAILLFTIVPCGNATEEFAEKTGKSCEYCHLDSSGGGELTKVGKEFLKKLKGEAGYGEAGEFSQERKGIFHYVRFLVGFLHIITAFFWLGTILYVHIILKPAYAAHGLPRSEVKIGLFSMIIMGITGTILTFHRVSSFSLFFETRFGILLLTKIVLFLIMVCTALYVVIFIGPKLKKTKYEYNFESKINLTVNDLIQFDGTDGRPAYVAYKDKVYNMTKSEHWKNGVHFGRHEGGRDLTGMLKQAPHGEDKIFKLPEVGKLVHSRMKKERGLHEKVFYFIAYLNLFIVILITLILALWRWW